MYVCVCMYIYTRTDVQLLVRCIQWFLDYLSLNIVTITIDIRITGAISIILTSVRIQTIFVIITIIMAIVIIVFIITIIIIIITIMMAIVVATIIICSFSCS